MLKELLFMWNHRKWADYVMRTWKIPLCECILYLKTNNCEHIDKIREDIKSLRFITK